MERSQAVLRGSSVSRSPLLPGITYLGSNDFCYIKISQLAKEEGKIVTHHLPVIFWLGIPKNGVVAVAVTAPIWQHHICEA